MAVDLNAMGTNIKTILAGVTGIISAYDYEPQNLQMLPAATIYFDGFDENEETLGRLQYDWRWTIRIYVPLSTSDIEGPQLTIRQLTSDILKAFRTTSNLTINGMCLYSKIGTGDIYTILNQTNSMIVSELTLTATTQETRT